MRFLIDVDGVVCDFLSGYLDLVHLVTGDRYTPEDVTDFDFRALGLVDHERAQIVARLFVPGWVRGLGELPGAVEAVRSLADRGHDVVFVTSPWRGHPTWAHEREQWLSERFNNARIISTNQKHYIAGDVLIDDKPQHVEAWAAHNPDGTGLLWDAPYNRGSFAGLRVSTWDHVLDWSAAQPFGDGGGGER